MRLEHFKAPAGNFGDDLNAWLWPRLFPEAFNAEDGTHFIGIGSILDERFANLPGKKIVFGTGARSRRTAVSLDPSWEIRFVRGPLTAAALGLEPASAITDGAAALALLPKVKHDPPASGRGLGLMPHFHSMTQANWEAICSDAGLTLIDPRWSVERVLASLCSVDRLITEAMHGAIVADLFRIPWVRITCHSILRETPEVAEFKWRDWGDSLRVATAPLHVGRLGFRSRRPLVRAIKAPWRNAEERLIRRRLATLANSDHFRLSTSELLEFALARVQDEVDRLRSEFELVRPNRTTAPRASVFASRTPHHTADSHS
jgi:hypothetical protein